MLGSIGKQAGESVRSVPKKKKGFGGKDLWKRKVLSLEWKREGAIDDDCGESIEEEVPTRISFIIRSIVQTYCSWRHLILLVNLKLYT